MGGQFITFNRKDINMALHTLRRFRINDDGDETVTVKPAGGSAELAFRHGPVGAVTSVPIVESNLPAGFIATVRPFPLYQVLAVADAGTITLTDHAGGKRAFLAVEENGLSVELDYSTVDLTLVRPMDAGVFVPMDAEIVEAIRRVRYAAKEGTGIGAGSDMCGVNLIVTQTMTIVAATDGQSAAFVQFDGGAPEIAPADRIEAFIPNAAIDGILNLSMATVFIGRGSNPLECDSVQFLSDVNVTVSPLAGKFPNVLTFLTRQEQNYATADRERFIAALIPCDDLALKFEDGKSMLVLDPKRMAAEVHVSSASIAEMKTGFPLIAVGRTVDSAGVPIVPRDEPNTMLRVGWPEAPFEVFANSSRLVDAVCACVGTNVRLSFDHRNRALICETDGGSTIGRRFVAMVAPLLVEKKG